MKKLFTFALFVFLFLGVKAQNDIVIGPKFGLNVSNITNSEMDNKASIHVGGFAEFKINDYLALQPELLYSRQGCRDKIDGTKIKVRVNYLSIPVLAKLYVLENLSVDLGPEFAFALNSKMKAKDGDTTIKEKLGNENTLVVNFGLGLSYNFEDIMVSARYNLGLSNVFDKDDYGSNNKNHVFQLSVGYRFGGLF